ncbi:MAG TPA: hypothetical protein VFQ35_28205, partial [Polyangiaceae bacterium]|nr:hypothetical protein [Polyangiaceae bacterium]
PRKHDLLIGAANLDPAIGESADIDMRVRGSRAGNGGFGYQAEPHPVFHVLADGTLEIVFGSDWGSQNLADTYVMRLAPM